MIFRLVAHTMRDAFLIGGSSKLREKIQLSANQTTLLCFVIVAGTQILIIPNSLVAIAQRDSWLGAILGVLIGIGVAFVYILLIRRFPNQSLAQLNELLFGKWLGKIISFLFYFFFFNVAVIMVRHFNEFISIAYFTRTPVIVFHIMLTVTILYGVWLGLETFSRALELFFPFISLLLFVLFLFSSPKIQAENFLPMFEHGIKPIVYSSIDYQCISTVQLVVLLVIAPAIQQKTLSRSILVGSIGCGVVLVLMTVFSIGVLGVNFVDLSNYATFALAKNIYIGDFTNRIEVFIVWIWFLTIFFKVCLFFYATSKGIAETLQLSDYRILLLPLSIILIVMTDAVFPNVVYFRELLPYWNSFSVTVGFILPLLMLLLAKVRKLQPSSSKK